MTALRKARPVPGGAHLHFAWIFCLGTALGLTGCGTTPPPADESAPPATPSPGTSDPLWLSSRGSLPAPDTERVEYVPQERLLKFHNLPAGDRWMVQLPDEMNARFVGPLHRLPEGVDITKTLVYYARPGAKISAPVTVAQIEAGRLPHSSLARTP
jgi:hypothetical protein